MLLTPLEGLSKTDIVEFECDNCGAKSQRTLNAIKQFWKKNKSKQCICTTCTRKIGATKRPQNNKEFIRLVGTSEAYYIGISNRPTICGSNNPMYGKRHTLNTRQKMSKARTGKIGPNATAWKGGKLSFTRRIKSAIQRKWKWFSKIIERDKSCTMCGSITKLDAHHIVPISSIIRTIIKHQEFESENTKYDFVINHELIKDLNLTNGKTLCRTCHKQVHQNWGSHEPKVSE